MDLFGRKARAFDARANGELLALRITLDAVLEAVGADFAIGTLAAKGIPRSAWAPRPCAYRALTCSSTCAM
jgi:hypothetical protein